MAQLINIVGILTAFIITTFISTSCIDEVATFSETKRGEGYSWVRAIPPKKGCWPDCAQGQWCWSKACAHYGEWPMSVIPLVAFNKLFMISNNSTWSSDDGIHWKQALSNAGWGERYGMPAIFFKNKIWKMGGMEKTWDNFKNDVWYSNDGMDWKIATHRSGWSPRRGHAAVVFDNKLWVLGGAESSGRPDKLPTRTLSDVWYSSDGVNWVRATDSAPWSGSNNAVVFQGKMWVIGDGSAWHSNDGRIWTKAISKASWLDRGGNGAAGCLVFDEKLWVFGGMDQRGTLNDVWFSRDGVHWQQAAARAPWTPRAAEHSVVFDNKLWIYGGKTGGADDGFSSDVWYMVSANQRINER